MMPDSGKGFDIPPRKAKKDRRKRLRIIRNRSDNLTLELDRNFVKDTDCRGEKRVAACSTTDFPTNTVTEEHEANLSEDTDGEPVGLLVEQPKPETLNYVSHGMISVIGRRRVMEDAVTVVPGGDVSFFAVYNGVSKARGARLHQLVFEERDGKFMVDGRGERKWEKVIKECFAKTDKEVNGGDGGVSGGSEGSSTMVVGPGKAAGSAAVVVMGKEEVVVANCGGSRAVLCRGEVPMSSSLDQKPDGADVKERLETTGGIGDQHLKPNMIAEPKVEVNKRTESDEFLIIASDGLWDVVPNDFACDVVRKCVHGQIRNRFTEVSNSAVAAAMLAELALARGSKDNISVIVVELKKSSS